jgi:hypothetical protein
MSKTPKIVVNPTPVFLDLTVKKLQDRLALCEYVDDTAASALFFDSGTIFGLAERDAETNAPRLFVGSDRNNIEYWRLEPNDELSSFAFFYESGTRVRQQGKHYLADLSLIVWYNQKNFDNVKFRIQEVFMNEVIQRLGVNNPSITTLQVFTRQSDVYADFTLPEDTHGWLSAPYDGFRIRFQIATQQDCNFVFNASTGNNC